MGQLQFNFMIAAFTIPLSKEKITTVVHTEVEGCRRKYYRVGSRAGDNWVDHHTGPLTPAFLGPALPHTPGKFTVNLYSAFC